MSNYTIWDYVSDRFAEALWGGYQKFMRMIGAVAPPQPQVEQPPVPSLPAGVPADPAPSLPSQNGQAPALRCTPAEGETEAQLPRRGPGRPRKDAQQ